MVWRNAGCPKNKKKRKGETQGLTIPILPYHYTVAYVAIKGGETLADFVQGLELWATNSGKEVKNRMFSAST